MKLLLTESSWILDDLNPIEWRFLAQLPPLASGVDLPADCRDRLTPNPLADLAGSSASEAEFFKDWKDYVEPDLELAFADSRERVSGDLAAAETGEEGEPPIRLEVPNDHSEPWFSVLNQARLLLNEAYGLAEASERLHPDVFGEGSEMEIQQMLLLAQYEFYTALQSILIEHRMDP